MSQNNIDCEALRKINPSLRDKPDTFCQDIIKVLTDYGYQLSEDGENFFNPDIYKVVAVSRLHELSAQKIINGTDSIKQYLYDHWMKVRAGEIFKFLSFLFGRLTIYSTVLLLIFGLFFISFKTIAIIVASLFGIKLVTSALSYLLRKEIEEMRQSF